jgi:hypothetical protein
MTAERFLGQPYINGSAKNADTHGLLTGRPLELAQLGSVLF